MLDSTLAGPSSNSYIDLAEADSIALTIPGGAEWVANTTEDEREFSLINATRWLETLDYIGDRCTSSQRLKWPRQGNKAICDGVQADCTFIPYPIREAEVILAIKYTEQPSSFPGAGGGNTAPSGTFVSRQKLGELEIQYQQFNNNTATSCDDCDSPELIQTFPWLEGLLGCWIFIIPSGAGRIIGRVRS
jgi:hypothetical protein